MPMEWGWISCRHSREGPWVVRAIIPPETPWLEAADCMAEPLAQASPKSGSSLCDRAVAGEEGYKPGQPQGSAQGAAGGRSGLCGWGAVLASGPSCLGLRS